MIVKKVNCAKWAYQCLKYDILNPKDNNPKHVKDSTRIKSE